LSSDPEATAPGWRAYALRERGIQFRLRGHARQQEAANGWPRCRTDCRAGPRPGERPWWSVGDQGEHVAVHRGAKEAGGVRVPCARRPTTPWT